MKKKPMKIEDFEKAGCSKPGCDCNNELFLHGSCHPNAPVYASYTKGSGRVLLACAVCDKPVCVVEVAGKLPALSEGDAVSFGA